MITTFRFDNSDFTEYANMIMNFKSHYTEMMATDLQRTGTSFPKSFRCVNLLNIESCGQMALFFTRLFTQTYVERHGLLVSHAAYYGKQGFIDWHTNANTPYWNAVCTFSANGNGFFEYKVDDQVVHMQDPVGWSVKKSRWGQPPVWHRAVSNDSDRITITFSSEEENRIDAFLSGLNNIDVVVEEELHPFLNQAPPIM
jgi:hypothetical protein